MPRIIAHIKNSSLIKIYFLTWVVDHEIIYLFINIKMKNQGRGNFPQTFGGESSSVEAKKYHNYSLSFYQKDEALN